MKFIVSSALLSLRLQTIGRVIVPKNNLAILENILFKVAGNQLTLVAADSEIMLTSTLELVESEGDVNFLINAKTIQDAIREIPEQPVDIYVNEENYSITVEYQNGKFNFIAQSADEYPLPPVMSEEGIKFSMNSQLLYTVLIVRFLRQVQTLCVLKLVDFILMCMRTKPLLLPQMLRKCRVRNFLELAQVR